MIIEFNTNSGATFRLDRELMAWERTYKERYTHGKLFTWPMTISVGKSVTIFNTDSTSRMGVSFLTTPIISMRELKRDEPDTIRR